MDHIFIDVIFDSDDKYKELAAVRTDRKGKNTVAYSDQFGLESSRAIDEMKLKLLDPKFDENYVVVAFKPISIKHSAEFRKALTGSWLYLTQLAWPICFSGLIPTLSLESISKHHGVINKAPATAQGNVVTVLESYWQMMRRYKSALTAEETVRSLGGDVLEGWRKELGF